jgi:ribose/xylose/arabinose/galactoside ABC-type transport system permease subunit
LTVGVIVGALNGFLILRLASRILLSRLFIVTGLALTVRPSPGGSVSETFSDVMTFRISSVPAIGVLAIILAIAGEIFLLRGRIGTRLYAVGSNTEGLYYGHTPGLRRFSPTCSVG